MSPRSRVKPCLMRPFMREKERRDSMRTLHPVDEETYARIGKAYLICSQHPDVFGDVTFEKFCSMFVDVIPDGKDEHESRKKAAAHEMYDMLEDAVQALTDHNPNSGTAARIESLLDQIDDVGSEFCDE